jgi:hypothetical protein
MRNPPAVAAFLVTLFSVSACGADSTGCVNNELERLPSPDRAQDAVVYVRECGATTGPGLNVSIVKPGIPLPDEPGNVLAIKDPAAMAAKPGDVNATWRTPSELQLTYSAGRGVSRALSTYNGTSVIHSKR